MNRQYIKEALKTLATNHDVTSDKLSDPNTVNILHAALGISTEAGEFVDAVKKHLFYGKPLDTVNIIEELGDLLWYMALACDSLGVSFKEVAEKNIEKLRKRYGDSFDKNKALNRNLDTERDALEK